MNTVRSCAVCGKPQSPEFKPFCSRRCADVDLQRWFAGSYAIPAESSPDEPRETDDDD
jgi:endogenous inhibitor of DNA gyrase (YacG/DUF329 family)